MKFALVYVLCSVLGLSPIVVLLCLNMICLSGGYLWFKQKKNLTIHILLCYYDPGERMG